MTQADLVLVVKAIAPVMHEYVGALQLRVKELETLGKGDRGELGPVGPVGPKGEPGRDGRDGLSAQGTKGLDGAPGTNGQDGLGFDDLSVLHDGERGITFRFAKGDRVKEFTVTVPALIYRGVFSDGKSYDAGDVVTYGGNAWYAKRNETTVKPDYIGQGPQAKDFWILMVKRGNDGKDNNGGSGSGALPVVKVR